MHEHAPGGGEQQIVIQELAEARLLTDVDNLLVQYRVHGKISQAALDDDIQNKATALCETSMPAAVTTTEHRVEYRRDETGRRQRVISWLGKTAIELAEAGREYYFSPAALKRVDIERQEAADAQENLTAGTAKVFISPKMSHADAPAAIAKAEHLYDYDSLRVSYAVTDERGEIVGRKMQSLLVRDISLNSWIAMLEDEGNIFGRSFDIENRESALSIMKLFGQLDIPEAALPEGPVTLVEAVLPYIENAATRKSVQHQLDAFRGDQSFYAEQAEKKAKEWSVFDVELAKSLETEEASFAIRRHIISLQHEWNEESLEIIERHAEGDAGYKMTRELAALLERSKRKELEGKIAVITGNEEAVAGVSEADRQEIIRQDAEIESMIARGMSAEQIQAAQMSLARRVIVQNIQTGGGCSGSVRNAFGRVGENESEAMLEPDAELMRGVGENDNPYEQRGKKGKSIWKWKSGVCQVRSCPTRPGATKVGPCSVCVRCQHKFDMGIDPTREIEEPKKPDSTKVVANVIRPLFGEKPTRERAAGKGVLRSMVEAA